MQNIEKAETKNQKVPKNNQDLSNPLEDVKKKKKNYWTVEEDEILAKAVSKYGSKRWSLISKRLPNRNPKRCRERWLNYLANKNQEWSQEEYWLLFLAYRVFKNRWSQIAKIINRGDNIVKNKAICMKKKRVQQFELKLNYLKSNPWMIPNLNQKQRDLLNKLIFAENNSQSHQTVKNQSHQQPSSYPCRLFQNQTDILVPFNYNTFIPLQNSNQPAFFQYSNCLWYWYPYQYNFFQNN